MPGLGLSSASMPADTGPFFKEDIDSDESSIFPEVSFSEARFGVSLRESDGLVNLASLFWTECQ